MTTSCSLSKNQSSLKVSCCHVLQLPAKEDGATVLPRLAEKVSVWTRCIRTALTALRYFVSRQSLTKMLFLCAGGNVILVLTVGVDFSLGTENSTWVPTLRTLASRVLEETFNCCSMERD